MSVVDLHLLASDRPSEIAAHQRVARDVLNASGIQTDGGVKSETLGPSGSTPDEWDLAAKPLSNISTALSCRDCEGKRKTSCFFPPRVAAANVRRLQEKNCRCNNCPVGLELFSCGCAGVLSLLMSFYFNIIPKMIPLLQMSPSKPPSLFFINSFLEGFQFID